jgi:gluconolactonase
MLAAAGTDTRYNCVTTRATATLSRLVGSFISCLLLFPGLAAAQGASTVALRDVDVAPIRDVIAASAEWQLAWEGTNNADGLVGLPDGSVLFAQEQPAQIGRLDLNDRYSIYHEGTRGVGSLSMDREGQLWGAERSCTDPGRRAAEPCAEATAIARLLPSRVALADSFEGRSLGRLNDLIADTRGGAYFTVGGAFYARASGRVTEIGTNLRTNGIILSPDETVLYVTNRETVAAFDVAPDGSAFGQRIFARLEGGGTGDGLTVDNEGRLYVTSGPGVQVFSAGGRYLGLIPTPRNSISAAFAGADKRSLYIVASGASLGPGRSEFTTPEGVRNNAKTIYRIDMLAQGYLGRAK